MASTIDRFFTPAELAVRSTFVPQTVQLPTGELQSLVDRRQKAFDETAAIGSGILGLEVGAIPADVELRDQILASREDDFNILAEEAGGDLSQVRGKAKALAMVIRKDMTRGRLGAIQSRFKQRQVFQEQLGKMSVGKDAIISPNTARSFLAISDNVNRELVNEQGGFNPYQSLTPVKEINPIERGIELTNKVAADGQGGFRIDKETGLIVTSSGEQVSRDKAFNASFLALSNDQETLNSIDQELVLNSAGGGQISVQQMDASINNIAATLDDPNLRTNIQSLINLDPRSKFRAVRLLESSDAVAGQIAFSKSKVTAKEVGNDFFDRINGIGDVQVRSQAVPVGAINSVSTEALNGIVAAISPEALEKSAAEQAKGFTKATDNFIKEYASRRGLGFFGKGAKDVIEESAKFIVGLFQPKEEIDRSSPDYLAVSSNIPNFDQMSQDRQDLAVSRTIIKRLDTQAAFNFTLDNTAKIKRDKNFILFGNPNGTRAKDTKLSGAFSSFTFINPEGKQLGAQEFREETGETPVTVVGVVTKLDAPVEFGSTIIEIEGNQWFMSPSESTRNTPEWFENAAKRSKYSPTYRTSFTYKGQDFTFFYDAKSEKAIQEPNR